MPGHTGPGTASRQRFVALSFDFPDPELEAEVLIGESNIDRELAQRLVQLAGALRALQDHDLEEGASTRLLVYTATLIKSGMSMREACQAALVEPLTDDDETLKALLEVVDAILG